METQDRIIHSTSRLFSLEIIEEGNSFKLVARTTTDNNGISTTTIPGAVTADENILKKNDLKARSIMMMTLPSEHLLTFNQHKDAKSLFEAIEARFGGNEATKKHLKNHSQKADLTILGEIITPEELNLKFLRSLPTEWGMHVVVWRDKTNDDNTANVHVSTGGTPISTASTNNSTACLSDATVYAYLATQPNGSQVVHEDLEKIHEDDLDEMDLKWQLALLSMKARKFYQRIGKKIVINGRDTAGYDKKRSRSQDSSRKTVNVEEASPKALLAVDGTGFDWSYMAEQEDSTNFALMAFFDFEVQNNKTCSKTCLKNYEDLKSNYDKLRVELSKSESDLYNYKRGLASVEEQLVFYKKNESLLYDQIAVLKRDASYNESDINALKNQVEKLKKEKEDNQLKIKNFENASKSLDQMIGNQLVGNNKKDMVLKENKDASKNVSKEVKKSSDAPIIEDWVSDSDEDETEVLESLNVQKPKQADQPRKVNQNPRKNSTNCNISMSKKLGVGFQFTPKACFVCGSFNHLIKDCDFHDKKMVQKPVLNNVKKVTGQREVRPVWTNAMRVNHQNFSNSKRNFAPKAVLTKSGLIPVSAARPINTALLKNRNLSNKVNIANVISVNTTVKEKRKDKNCWNQEINAVQTYSVTGHEDLKVLNSPYFMVKSWLVQDQTVSALTIPGQTTTGYTLESGKDSLKLIALMDLCTTLFDKVIISEMLLLSIRRFMLRISHVDEESSSSDFRCRRLFDFREFYQTGEDVNRKSMNGRNKLQREIKLQSTVRLQVSTDRSNLVQLSDRNGHKAKDSEFARLQEKRNFQEDLKMIFDPNEEDDIWLNQHYWELLRWKLHEYSGVHSLFLDGTSIQINMLVEKKYPLKKAILEKMINLKIEAEEDSNMAYELIKFIKS
ncbi:hypothetical protein Tco_0378729 [Tanacetum coccineum]